MKISECAVLYEACYPNSSPARVAIALYLIYREATRQGVEVCQENIAEIFETASLRESQRTDQLGGLVEASKEQAQLVREGSPDMIRLLELSSQKDRLLKDRADADLAMWCS